MQKVHLIMPMGGAGSRFFKDGFVIPKPLIEIKDKPFLYWSTISITNFVDVLDVTFVVLKEHIDKFHIDKEILKYFPDAKIQVIPEILNGAVLMMMPQSSLMIVTIYSYANLFMIIVRKAILILLMEDY